MHIVISPTSFQSDLQQYYAGSGRLVMPGFSVVYQLDKNFCLTDVSYVRFKSHYMTWILPQMQTAVLGILK